MPTRIIDTADAVRPGVEKWLYIQIASLVRQKIEVGELKAGDLVSATNLAKTYQISRFTAAKGLRLLAEEGQLKFWPGCGYNVQAHKD